jgi:hypothetical protein
VAELCIKGTAFLLARRDLLAHVEAGSLTRQALERRLEPGDLPHLDTAPLATSWYPVAVYERMLRVLLDLEGGGDPQYLVDRARKSMQALMRGGIYKQLERAEAVVKETGRDWFERSGHILATLPSAFFNLGAWRLSRDGSRGVFTLEGSGVDLPPCVQRIVQGAVEYVAEQLTEGKVAVVPHAVGPARVRFVGTEERRA